MSVEIYLKLDGIAGGSRNFAFKGCTDITSWAWEMDSNRNTSELSENDKTACRQISVVKRIGMESPDIMAHYMKGKVIPYANLTAIPLVSKREARQKYLSIHMEEVLIKSIMTGGNATEEFFNETLVLLFGRVRTEFTVNPAIGSDVSTATDYSFAWDIAHNRDWPQQ